MTAMCLLSIRSYICLSSPDPVPPHDPPPPQVIANVVPRDKNRANAPEVLGTVDIS